ncbi:protein lethal(2)denticleless-like isoform X1 [Daphnia pulex]|uniref:protein lethal(2)denticleless-like isoform X1 n=1 Tax=Daphnia pulex TaxID=6669 RepID=UPI001EDFD19C|nr:protein lethal(2)denticleless-like isoform X1 [Daphnia pulex]
MISSLINRQYGSSTGKEEFSIDFLLTKLQCHQDDEYPGIFSTSNSAPSSDLLYACKFSQSPGFEHIVALANEDGKIAFQDTNVVGKARPVHGTQAHENAIFDLCWAPSSWQIVTASGDQTSILFDIGRSSISPISIFRGHTASIKSVDFSPTNSSLFASGSRDGAIMVWDTRGSIHLKAENVIKNAHPVQAFTEVKTSRTKKRTTPSASGVSSVTSVLFQNDYTLLSAGAADGNIHVWDLRKNYTVYKGDPLPKTSIPYGWLTCRSGIASLSLDPGKTLLYAAAMDDVIYEFNVASYDENPVGVYGGHEQHSFYIKSCLSGDGKYLISGSSDDHAYVWKVGAGPRPLLKLDGHGAEVTCVAWSSNNVPKVLTCADDVRHRIWRINTTEETNDADNIREIRGHAYKFDAQTPIPKSCEEALVRIKKKVNVVPALGCKTPKSILKVNQNTRILDRTPDILANSPRSSNEHLLIGTPRIVLSPLTSINELTPNQSGNSSNINRAAASRRLEMDRTDYSSPTRDLPNYVADGVSPHSKIRSSTKRKKLDWLTDLSRKITPNSQNKMRRIK